MPHSHDSRPLAPPPVPSLLLMSAGQRLALAGIGVAAIWAAVLWAWA